MTSPYWNDIKKAHHSLAMVCREGGDIAVAWRDFEATVKRSADDPPFNFRALTGLLEEIGGSRTKSDIRILDHGCGSALWLLYLLANGYRGIHGIDVGGHCDSLNRLMRDHLGLKDKRFFLYDGSKLPFDDDQFDIVFSTQVIEHIAPDVLENYYAEERRVLAPGGMAYHQVPHRLVPYDSHTRTWFIHYLPRPVWLAILSAMGRDPDFARNQLFLRWPWVHRRLARRHIGTCDDRTMARFMSLTDLSGYDGPRGLRRFVRSLLALPGVGWLGQKLLANFVMLDTISRTPTVSASNAQA